MHGQELVDALRAAAETELPNLPVVFAYLYGSRTGTRGRPDSDIDVGILLDPDAAVGSGNLLHQLEVVVTAHVHPVGTERAVDGAESAVHAADIDQGAAIVAQMADGQSRADDHAPVIGFEQPALVLQGNILVAAEDGNAGHQAKTARTITRWLELSASHIATPFLCRTNPCS